MFRRCWHCRLCQCRCSCRKLITFLTSYPETFAQFQTKWQKPSLNEGDSSFLFVFFSMTGLTLLQREIITKKQKYVYEILKSSSQEQLGKFQPNLARIILG